MVVSLRFRLCREAAVVREQQRARLPLLVHSTEDRTSNGQQLGRLRCQQAYFGNGALIAYKHEDCLRRTEWLTVTWTYEIYLCHVADSLSLPSIWSPQLQHQPMTTKSDPLWHNLAAQRTHKYALDYNWSYLGCSSSPVRSYLTEFHGQSDQYHQLCGSGRLWWSSRNVFSIWVLAPRYTPAKCHKCFN